MICPICQHPNSANAPSCARCNAPLILQNKYAITQVLARETWGAIYLGKHLAFTGVTFAITELVPDQRLAPAEQQQIETQWQIQANQLRNLQHPALPRVWDFFGENQRGYLVTDYVSGESLAAQLQRTGTPFPDATVRAWANELCDLLSMLHAQTPPILLRDLTPQNLTLAPNGDIRVMTLAIGKPHVAAPYAAIECYGTGAIDARSDIYTQGITLWQLLTNQLPPAAPDRVAQPTLAPRAMNAAISPALASVIVKAIELNPQQRFQSAVEMARALQNPSGISAPSKSRDTALVMQIIKLALGLGGGASTLIGIGAMLLLSVILIIIVIAVLFMELSYLKFIP